MTQTYLLCYSISTRARNPSPPWRCDRQPNVVQCRSCIDVKESSRKHASITPKILTLHALTGCDSVAATYGVGKTPAITVARKSDIMDQLDQPKGDIVEVTKRATAFTAASYSSTTECRQRLWVQKKTAKSTHKLCSLPPTNEAFEQNVRNAHYQVAQCGWHKQIPNSTQHGRWSILHPAHQSDHVEMGTVVAWGVNWFVHCSSPVVVFLCAQIHSTSRSI